MIRRSIFLLLFIIHYLDFVYAQNYKVGVWDSWNKFRGTYNFTDTVSIVQIKPLLTKLGDENYVVYVGTTQVNLENYKLPYRVVSSREIPLGFRPSYKEEKIEGGFYLNRDSLLDGAWLVFKVDKAIPTLYLKKSIKSFLLDGEMVMHGFNGKLHQILFYEKGILKGVIVMDDNNAVSSLSFKDKNYVTYFDKGIISSIEELGDSSSTVLYHFDKLGRIIYDPNKILLK
jgi:hypothetical protein